MVVLLLAAVAAVIAFFAFRLFRGPGDGLERLVALCYRDAEMAERLIAREAERRPSASRRVLIDRAIERLQDDRRR